MTDNVDPTREMIERRIADEGELLGRVTAFVVAGVRAGRIGRTNADRLIAAAQAAHDANVRALRGLLGEPED